MKIANPNVIQNLLLSLIGGLAAISCANRDPHFALLGKSQNFLTSPINKKVDILWVIDNSGTMGPKQTNLANSINSFMSSFVTKNFDYQISVVTTDTRTTGAGGQGACAVGAPAIISPSTANPAAALATTAQVGFFGDSAAKGLDAVKQALSAPNSTGCNNGFVRDGAFLAIVFFSDADDNDSVNSTNNIISFVDSIKTPFTTPDGTAVRSWFASAMVAPNASSAACQALGPATETGTKFLSIATQTGGPTADICQPNFSSGLLAVSNKILEATTAVHLAAVPDVATIIVIMNNAAVAQDATNGWTYDSATNSIVFHGSAIPDQANTSIIVNFTPADIIR